MDPAVQMDPPYFSIKEAINQIQNNMVSSQSQTERIKNRKRKYINIICILYVEVFDAFYSNKIDEYFRL